MKNDITQAIKTAMKARDKVALSALRGLNAAIKNLEIDAGKPLEDGEVLGVIRTQVKQLHETIEGFNAAGRSEDADEEHAKAAGEEAQGEPDPLQRLARLHDGEAGAAGAREGGGEGGGGGEEQHGQRQVEAEGEEQVAGLGDDK